MSSPLLRIAKNYSKSTTAILLSVLAVILFINVILSGVSWGSATKLDDSDQKTNIERSSKGLMVTTLLSAIIVAYMMKKEMMF